MSADCQVGPNTFLRIAYRSFDGDGDPISGSAPIQLEVLFGFGQLPSSVEAALAGLVQGRSVRVRLTPDEAFGQRDPTALLEVDRSEFPEDAAAGDSFDAENATGETVTLKILEITPDVVVVDLNHPLAGQPVYLEVLVEGVRPATDLEVELAVARVEADQEPTNGLIPLGRLRQGPPKRYEGA